jgi:AAA domain
MEPTPDAVSQLDPAPPIGGSSNNDGDMFSAERPDTLLLKALLSPDRMTPNEQATVDAYRIASQKAQRRRDLLGLVDLADVMEGGDTEPEMLVDDLLVRGMHHIVYGKKQSGKTWVLLWAAAVLIRRGETVIWIDEEMGRQEMARRLKWIGVPSDDVEKHFVYCEFPALDRSSESLFLWTELLELRQPSLVVADAHTEVLAAADLNENSGTDVAKWNADYVSPARRLGAATAFIDHTGHDEQGRPVGSRHKGAQAKVELAVVCKEPFSDVRLGVIEIAENKNTIAAPIPKRRFIELGGEGQADGTLGFVFRPDKGTGRQEGEQAAREALAILEAVGTATKQLSKTQISDIVGGNNQANLRLIGTMVDEGLLVGHEGSRGAVYTLGGESNE